MAIRGLRGQLLFSALAVAVLGACSSSTWTAHELSSWYQQYAEGSPHYSKLWYRGSDSNYHYFTCRAIDSWVNPRVPRPEIVLEDVRPVAPSSGPFPGYYAVDPSDGFRPIPGSDSRNSKGDGEAPNADTAVR